MDVAASYDTHYRTSNYFGYRRWMYRPYIASLLAVAGVERGSTVLDVGCGQGFFSYLLRTCGMNVVGIDLSEAGVQSAKRAYGERGMSFLVGDAMNLPLAPRFDCIFVRSLSLYNIDDFSSNSTITDTLLARTRENGCLVFLYNTKLGSSAARGSWRYHSLDEAREHFSRCGSSRLFFISKIDTVVLGRCAFNKAVSHVNAFLSRHLGRGGDIVCVLRRS